MLARRHVFVALLLGLILLAAILAVALWKSKQNAALKDVAEEVLFSDAVKDVYTDLEGRQIDLLEYDDKPLLVTSWASWCPQCQGELVLINKLVKELYPGRITVLALNRNEPKEQAQRFLSTLPPLPAVTFTLDTKDHYFSSIGGYAMPESLLYSAAGELVYHKRGNFSEAELRAALNSLFTDTAATN
jgi:thiol-disulfide isomerase/thioredoxin